MSAPERGDPKLRPAVVFIVESLEYPPTIYGVLEGPFGTKLFYNQPAGFGAVEMLTGVSEAEKLRLKREISASWLPTRGSSLEMEELVVERPPDKYVM